MSLEINHDHLIFHLVYRTLFSFMMREMMELSLGIKGICDQLEVISGLVAVLVV